eukprot:359991-Chlamydomonas_euryale.AAC.1
MRPKQPADRLLCPAVVTRHHLLLSLTTRLLRPGVAHGASPHSTAGSGSDPASRVTSVLGSREALPAAGARPAAYQGPASA